MLKTPLARGLYTLIVMALVLVIGRNLYRRYLNDALISAVERGHSDAVRDLLARGADANSVLPREEGERSGRRVVFLAVSRFAAMGGAKQREDIACLLIEHGANIHQPFASTAYYLGNACDYAGLRLLRCLLDHGANPDVADGRYDTPLKYAINYGLPSPYTLRNSFHRFSAMEDKPTRLRVSREMVTLLIAHGARPTPFEAVQLEDAVLLQKALGAGANANQQDASGQTPLFMAASQGSMPLMQTLLAHGADARLQDSQGKTALNMAAGDNGSGGSLEAVRLLLRHGAAVNTCGAFADPPLVTAIHARHADIARLLLQSGADPTLERKDAATRACALSAAAGNLPQLVPELLARGVSINADEGGALKAALRARDVDTARYLLQQGAKIYPANRKIMVQPVQAFSSGMTLLARPRPELVTLPSTLRVAVTAGPKCFELLMRAGADITPDKPDILLAAASAGQSALFERLIALGANVNAEDGQGKTPLTEAFLRAPDGVETLLTHGANPNVITQLGQMPLIMAAQNSDINAARLLLAHGANVNLKSPRTHTPLYVARRHKSAALVSLLEQAGGRAE